MDQIIVDGLSLRHAAHERFVQVAADLRAAAPAAHEPARLTALAARFDALADEVSRQIADRIARGPIGAPGSKRPVGRLD